MTTNRQLTQTGKIIDDFVEDLAGSAPVPGGGGASAIAGSIGTALGGMVASLTLGKEKYENVEDEIKTLKSHTDEIQKRLLKLADADAQVFSKLSAVYGMPKESDCEKQSRSQAMEAALKDAADVPLMIMKETSKAISLMDDFARKGNKMAVSDAGCGVILCKSALQSAWLNVCINTKAMKDRVHANKINEEGRSILQKCVPLADKIYSYVEAELI